MQRSPSFCHFGDQLQQPERGERESSSHKAKKSTEKSSGAASESVRPSPSSATHPQNFHRTSPPRDDDARSFQGPPLPPAAAPP
jgi:hypothetical protein